MAVGLRNQNAVIKEGQEHRMKISLQVFDIMNDITKEMYNQAKEEGHGSIVSLRLILDLTYSIRFIYDDKSQIPQDHLVDSDDFVAEFKKYPRAKEYTPMWWQEILGKESEVFRVTISVKSSVWQRK